MPVRIRYESLATVRSETWLQRCSLPWDGVNNSNGDQEAYLVEIKLGQQRKQYHRQDHRDGNCIYGMTKYKSVTYSQ
jgi:hypothetical protein